MWINFVTVISVVFLLIKFLAEEILWKINGRHTVKHRQIIPHGFDQFIDLPTYQKSIDYSLAKTKFFSICNIWDLVLNVFIIVLGFFPFLLGIFNQYFGSGILGQSMTFLTINIILSLFSIPFDWYRQFYLEEAFGFNRLTRMMFWTDKLKNSAISFLIGIPIVSILIYCFQQFPNSWWILGWAILMLFQVIAIIVYPLWILPLFNKLTPLPDGELKERLTKLVQEAAFPISKIYIMDGSKRSSHSNAFFTGFGKFRHIVLYDTLIQQLSTDEIAAVLAHEIGHCKYHHIRTGFIVEGFLSLLGFGILYYLSTMDWVLKSFGFNLSYINAFVPLVLIFSIVAPTIIFWITPLLNHFSRQHEYEADQFSTKVMHGSKSLISGLRKTYKENLSNLTPHPIYTAFYYSHPAFLERESALAKN